MGSMHCVKVRKNASDTVPSDKLETEQMYQGGVLPNMSSHDKWPNSVSIWSVEVQNVCCGTQMR